MNFLTWLMSFGHHGSEHSLANIHFDTDSFQNIHYQIWWMIYTKWYIPNDNLKVAQINHHHEVINR